MTKSTQTLVLAFAGTIAAALYSVLYVADEGTPFPEVKAVESPTGSNRFVANESTANQQLDRELAGEDVIAAAEADMAQSGSEKPEMFRQMTLRAARGAFGRKQSDDRELTVELGPGVRAPIALLEDPEGLAPAKAKALREISADVIERVNAVASSMSEEELAQLWTVEQEDADAHYRIVFGDEAYLQMSLESAANARADSEEAAQAAPE